MTKQCWQIAKPRIWNANVIGISYQLVVFPEKSIKIVIYYKIHKKIVCVLRCVVNFYNVHVKGEFTSSSNKIITYYFENSFSKFFICNKICLKLWQCWSYRAYDLAISSTVLEGTDNSININNYRLKLFINERSHT